LIATDDETLNVVIKKAAKIGYEKNIKAALICPDNATEKLADLDLDNFVHNTESYTIVDVRNHNETAEQMIFKSAVTVPLPELRERINEIPTDKPIVVHCAAGYRSAAAVSILKMRINDVEIYDLGEVVVEFQKALA
jgi:rhodanese-related sulfurtransferase